MSEGPTIGRVVFDNSNAAPDEVRKWAERLAADSVLAGEIEVTGMGALEAQCKLTQELLAAIRQWDRADRDFQRGVAPAHLLHKAESRLRALARGEA